jgi:AraC-like DNA-binding protein
MNCNTSVSEIMHEIALKIDQKLTDQTELRTAIDSLSLNRFIETTKPTGYIHKTSLCMIAQGAKVVQFKGDSYRYSADTYLITPLDLPVQAHIIEASKEFPYLGIRLDLDPREIALVVTECSDTLSVPLQKDATMSVGRVSEDLATSVLRLINLLDHPEDIPFLAPLIQKEILYRILRSDQGASLLQIGVVGSRGHQISRAIEWLKNHFTEPLKVDVLAERSGMSNSAFHHHFREMTDMSPLQYQKWLRLSEARKLMITERMDAATASFQVGYESPSQFSREYSRMFGLSPLRDVKRLMEATKIA